MRVRTVAIADLVPDPNNARKHGKRNVEAIKSSLERFGQQKPIVIDSDNVVRAGNGTMEAAKQLGWERLKVLQTSLEGAEAVAYAIADNRTGELAEWDLGPLEMQLGEIPDILELGFTDEDLEGLFDKFDVNEDDLPPLPDGDRDGFCQMTFTLSDEQASGVQQAMKVAKDTGPFEDTGNKNSNGNALSRIAEAYLGSR